MSELLHRPFSTWANPLREVHPRAEIDLEEVPAPQKLAPFSLAFTADLESENEATGRFIVLHDPAGQEGWGGAFRTVTFIRTTLDRELADDPVLMEISWSWLTESLKRHDCEVISLSGTVTCVNSASFGTLIEREPENEIEIRASWTPTYSPHDDFFLVPHFRAWLDLMATAAGLAPLPEGATSIRRNQS